MIRLENVSRRWPEFALSNISLEVKEGEYLVVLGPTGAGKTLMLELLLGIYTPDSGRIFLNGKDITDLAPEKRGLGMVYQDFMLFPHLTVEGNIAYGLQHRRISKEVIQQKVLEVSKFLGIDHLIHRRPGTLSGGEKQRTALGRALVMDPKVLFMDEPMSALDRQTARRLRGELKEMQRSRNLTVIHVTHDLSEARQMADRIALIHEGRLEAIDAPDRILRYPPTVFAARFMGAPNIFPASLTGNGETLIARAGNLEMPAVGCASISVHLMVLPEKVLLNTQTDKGTATSEKNCVFGEVSGLIDEAGLITVLVRAKDLPEPLSVHVSHQTVESLGIHIGSPVIADTSNALNLLVG